MHGAKTDPSRERCVVPCQHGKARNTEVKSEDGEDEAVQSKQLQTLQEVI